MLRTALCLLAGAQLLIGCNVLQNYFEPVEPAETWSKSPLSPAPAPGSTLKVMNWNIKFGGARIDFFYDCFGDRSVMTEAEVTANMDALVAKIRELNPDILLLQEVDVASKRSAYLDQIQYILDRTELNYGVYASQWRVDFIPVHGLGQMDDGNAILSRWPIKDGERIALALSDEQAEYERQFYLKRNILKAKLEIPGHPDLGILAIHADAYSKDGTKEKHIRRLKKEMDAFNSDGVPFIAGGDLNTLPPGTVKTSGFPDTVCKDEAFIADDYSSEAHWLDDFYAAYDPAISLERYAADNSKFFSHTVDGRGSWNRTLDYLFTNLQWTPDTGTVHQDTLPLSDHAPVTAVLEIGEETKP